MTSYLKADRAGRTNYDTQNAFSNWSRRAGTEMGKAARKESARIGINGIDLVGPADWPALSRPLHR
jgi:hypothetical protein